MSHPTLPSSFERNMLSMLGENEGRIFLNSYSQPRTYGLRLNTLKIIPGSTASEQLRALFNLEPVPWCASGFYYDKQQRPGKHAYHAAGLYYIQEPSAMSAVELLDPKPGETVLDLAAAPGGKTTQIAMKMAGKGILISNEIHPQRAKILAENVERIGATNVVVTQATPGELAARFPAVFDRIMLDAPCSGEGMFRKDPAAIAEWSLDSVNMCAARQWDILQDAITMLKPGGYIAYSTCTFNRQENEETVSRILREFSFMRLVTETRIWPHLQKGEGHYVALLQRMNENNELLQADSIHCPASNTPIIRNAPFHLSSPDTVKKKRKERRNKGSKATYPDKTAIEAYEAFLQWTKNSLKSWPPVSAQGAGVFTPGVPILFGESLYWLPSIPDLPLSATSLDGLKIPRAGLHLGEYRKGRFQPGHALAMALHTDHVSNVLVLEADSPQVAAYLHGDVLPASEISPGWCLVAIRCEDKCYSLGWGKASGGQVKNHLPKGLRQ